MNRELLGVLPSVVILGGVALIALFLTFARGWADDCREHMRGAVLVALSTVLFQAVHFVEELLTGLHERLPALFGLAAIPLRLFVSFNLAWLAVWGLSLWGLAGRRRAALFPLWFLGLASVGNGFLHPLAALLLGGYFPGLVSAPVAGVMGFLLLKRLLLVTESADAQPRRLGD